MSVSDVILEKMSRFFAIFFGSANDRELKRIWPLVDRVNTAWKDIRPLADEQIRAKTDEFRRRLLKGETEDDILPEAFACCREASHRTLGNRQMIRAPYPQLAVEGDRYDYKPVVGEIPLFAHFDVQVIGGIVLHTGRIAEMVTGEGKTLVATLPTYLNALRPNEEWVELARKLQGPDVDQWVFKPYGRFRKAAAAALPDAAPAGETPADAPAPVPAEGDAAPAEPSREEATEWRLMDALRPDPEDPAAAFAERPEEIVGISRGVHVVTVNDYLAQRDADYNRPLFNFLGIDVGAIQAPMDARERYPIYRGDVVYGTNSEFGFDYLRDNLKVRKTDQVQAGRFYAIVDEVDSVLVDEARTPLIISGSGRQAADRYYLADRIARRLAGGDMTVVEDKILGLMREGLQREDARMKVEEDFDFVYSERDHSAKFTERGVQHALRLLGIDDMYSGENLDLPHFLDNALRAHALYHKDHHYIVRDGQVFIVDEFTGRVLDGRRWSDGLHQAVEAKEGLRIKEESQTVATITYQNFFRLYDRLAGMTGTAMTEAKEFDRIYRLGVMAIPTNRPLKRVNYPDLVYGTLKEKYNAVADHIEEVHATGRPILIGTASVERSELISQLLERRGIPHEVLNAKNHAREAMIVAQAGQLGAVTVATNMAGRGTDIKLGSFTREELLEHWQKRGLAPKQGVAASMSDDAIEAALLPLWVKHYLAEEKAEFGSKTPEEWRKLLEKCWTENGFTGPVPGTNVAELGGLHIVGTERHESRRIDNQLRGRAGRQGDPGSSRFFLSLEDDTMRLFASDKVKKLMQWMGLKDGVPIESKMVSNTVENAQRKVEERNFEIRKNLIEYDGVMNEQRTVVYQCRQDWVEDRGLKPSILGYCRDYMADKVKAALSDDDRDAWDIEGLKRDFTDLFQLQIPDDKWEKLKDLPDAEGAILELADQELEKTYDAKEERTGPELMRMLEKMILLETIDRKWMDHLYAMELLREGIHLRSFAGQDPKIRYKIEGFEMFEEMWNNLRTDVAGLAVRANLTVQREVREQAKEAEAIHEEYNEQAAAADAVGADAGEAAKPRTIRNDIPKTGPNDPCPCGSGKKYKKCHGR